MAESDEEDLARELFVINDYVNSSHEIIGRDIYVDGQKMAYYAIAHDGDDFAFELDVAGALKFSGDGTDDSGEINGKFDLTVSGMKLFDVEVEEFDYDALDDGELNGTFRILINKQLLSMVDLGEYDSIIKGIDGIEIKSEGDSDEASMEFNVIYNGKTLVGIAGEGKKYDSESIDIPSKGDVIDITDGGDPEEFLKAIDFDEVIDNMKEAGVPNEIISVLEMALKSGF